MVVNKMMNGMIAGLPTEEREELMLEMMPMMMAKADMSVMFPNMLKETGDAITLYGVYEFITQILSDEEAKNKVQNAMSGAMPKMMEMMMPMMKTMMPKMMKEMMPHCEKMMNENSDMKECCQSMMKEMMPHCEKMMAGFESEGTTEEGNSNDD